MELKQLRYFLAVAEELHFGRAAERLKVEQPVLTRCIQDLEREVGYPLLLREGGGIELTSGGRSFLEGARSMLGEPPRPVLTSVISRAPGPSLRIGQLASLTSRVIPQMLTAFRERYPDTRLQLSTGSSAEHVGAIRGGACDLAFVRLPVEMGSDFAHLTLEEEPLRVAMAPTNPLASQATVHPKDLAEQPLIFFPRELNAALHDHLLEKLRQATSKDLHIVTQAPTLESFLSSIRICEAAALVTTSQASDAPRYGLSVRPLNPGWNILLGLAWRKEALSVAGQAFVHLAQSLSSVDPLRSMLVTS